MSERRLCVLSVVALALIVTTCGGGGPTGPSLEQATAGQGQGQDQELGETADPGPGELTLCPTPGNPNKTLICHIPPGNPSNAHEICVGRSAVPAHLAHGDFLGECAVCPPDEPYCCPPDDPYCEGA